MSTTVSSGSTATFGMDAFASLAVAPSASDTRGTITFTSAAPNSRVPSFTAKLQAKEFGPFLVPMSVSIVVEDGSCTYQLTGNAGGYSYDSNNNVTGLVGPDGNRFIPTRKPYGNLCFFGDSLTAGLAVSPPIFETRGLPVLGAGTVTTTNLGGGNWLVSAWLSAAAVGNGILQTDGAGRLSLSTDAGASYGPYKDVSAGGWYVLQNGDATLQCTVYIRGATAPPAVPGTGAVTKAGIVYLATTSYYSYSDYLTGVVADSFTRIERWAVGGVVSADVTCNIRQCLADALVSGDALDAAVLLSGTNDIGAGTNATTLLPIIATIKTNIDLLRSKFGRVYVGAIFPNPSSTAGANALIQLCNSAIEDYCRPMANVRFWSAWDYLQDPNSYTVPTARTGVYYDNLHLQPYGAMLAAKPLIALVTADYPIVPVAANMTGVWDATVGAGPWNVNPTVRGVGGTVTPAKGITGTCPDGWTLTRSGSAQLITTGFAAADDGKGDWWTITASVGTAGEFHQLSQVVNIPTGVSVGDKFIIRCECAVLATTNNGISMLAAYAISNGNIEALYAMQNQTNREIQMLNSDKHVFRLATNPMVLLAGVTNFTLLFRVGATDASATGTVGLRNFSIEKVA